MPFAALGGALGISAGAAAGLTGSVVAGAGALAGGLIGSGATQSAAQTQANAANQSAQIQEQMFQTTQGNLQPWMTGGGNALAALQRALGLTPSGGGTSPGGAPGAPGTAGPQAGGGGAPAPGSIVNLGNGYSMQVGNDGHLVISNSDFSQMQNYPAGTSPGDAIGKFSQAYGVPPTAFNIPATGGQAGAPTGAPAAGGFQAPTSPYGGFQASPGYQFQLGQGLQSVQNSAAARGGLAGGNTLKALQQYGTGLANQDWYNYLSQLTTLSGVGENAAANLGNNAATSGANIGGALVGAGAANAAGTIGSANALAGGISGIGTAANGGINNYLMYSLLNGGGGNSLGAANNASLALGPVSNSNIFNPSVGYGGFSGTP